MNTVKKLFGEDCHVERPQNNTDCIEYIFRTDKRKFNMFECGTRPMNNGVHSMADMLQNCATIDDVKTLYPDTYIRFHKGIEKVYENKNQQNRFFKKINVTWIAGSTGTGKTRTAFELGAQSVIYNNGFYSDWGSCKTICIEELRGEIPYAELLKLCDSYHNYYYVNIKGGQKRIDLDHIIITSPLTPWECYPKQMQKIDSILQLIRRITTIEFRYPDQPDRAHNAKVQWDWLIKKI